MSVFITIEVLIRKFLSLTTQGAEEYSSYVLAFVSAWSFSYGLIHKAHIRIDLVYEKLADSFRHILDVLSLISLTIFLLPMNYYAFEVLKTSFLRGSRANTPLKTLLWIPQALWFLGILFFLIVTIIYLYNVILCLYKGQPALANEIAACPLFDETIKEETGSTVEIAAGGNNK
jgi:TRAP-type mannitol/chloroaromatic compound transport system permease small subunit